MALEEYRRKRDFSKTGEPPPGKVTARNKQLSYLIQKHDATRLHYDFRLELDGVTEPTLNGATVHAMRKDRASCAGITNLNPEQWRANQFGATT